MTAPLIGRRKRIHAIGLMSGTSCDGHSGALISLSGQRPAVKLRKWGNLPYPTWLRSLLLKLASGEAAPAEDFARASDEIAQSGARVVRSLLRSARLNANSIGFVGVHGHTLFHGPRLSPRSRTWQAGNLSLLAEMTGITVVGDFRSRDAAAGGEGAPLAPFGHWVLFAHPRRARLILNLGGIANVTWLPAAARMGDVRAFDTGPGNMLLDLLAERISRGRLRHDPEGRLAARGKVNAPVLRRILADPFFRRRPPKSTGREKFGSGLIGHFRRLSGPDALATACELTASAQRIQLDRWLPATSRAADVYVAGGGVRNRELMRRLKANLFPRRVHDIERLGYPSQTLEPVCFALLAFARLLDRVNVMPRVTGASRAVSAGAIVPGR